MIDEVKKAVKGKDDCIIKAFAAFLACLLYTSYIFNYDKNATVKVLDIVVPIMAVCYFAITIFIIIKNIGMMPSVFSRIFEEDFGIRQVAAGGFGAVRCV